MYEYRAICREVYDGDTITIDIDLGFGVWLNNQKVRLADINTPEVRGRDRSKGLKVRDYIRSLLLDKEIVIKTKKDSKGKFGRWLVEVFYPTDSGGMKNCNQLLLEMGYAKRWEG